MKIVLTAKPRQLDAKGGLQITSEKNDWIRGAGRYEDTSPFIYVQLDLSKNNTFDPTSSPAKYADGSSLERGVAEGN